MRTDVPSNDPTMPWTRRDGCAVLVLVVVAVGVYADSIPNGFVYDDHAIVVNDARSHSLSRVGELFSGGYWTVTVRPLYRPITLLSFALNHAVTGLSAPAYRVVNVLLHALTCVVLFRLMMLVFGRFWSALVAGAVYAVHPIHVEAVVPIVGRSELLSGLFVLTALVLYVGDSARGGRRLTWRHALVVLLMWASMLCKESAIVLIGMVVVFDVWQRSRLPAERCRDSWYRYLAGRFAHRYLSILLAIVVVLLMRQWAIGMMFGEGVTFPRVDNPLVGESWPVRILMGLVLLGKYAHLLLTGYPLCADYSYNAIPVPDRVTGGVLVGLMCVVLGVAAVVVSLRRRREVALAIGWFAVSYAPVANVLVLIGTIFAERLTYLPSAMAAIIWGLAIPGLSAWLREQSRRGIRAIQGVVLAATVAGLLSYSVLTVLRNRTWRDDETLFRDAVAKQPNSARSQFNIGAWLATHGNVDEGIEHLRRSVEIAGQYYLARTKLAATYIARHQWRETAEVLIPLVESTDSRSEHLIPPLLMLGTAHLQLGDMEAAWACYARIRQIQPRHTEAMRCQAEIMSRPDSGRHHKPEEAWALIQFVVNQDREGLASLATASRIAIRQGRFIEANLYLKRAFEAAKEAIQRITAQGRALDKVEKRSIQAMARDLEAMRQKLWRINEQRREHVISSPTQSAPSR